MARQPTADPPSEAVRHFTPWKALQRTVRYRPRSDEWPRNDGNEQGCALLVSYTLTERQTMQQPSSEGGGAPTSELQSDAKQLGVTAANRIHSEVDARKDSAVGQAKSTSSAIQRVADGMDQSSPEWLKSAFQQGAQKIQQFADTIEQKDSRELMRDAQDFARNNPGTFLAACAAAGFAAARILKAGGQQQQGISGQQQPTQLSAIGTPPTGGQSQSHSSTSARTRGEFA